MGGMAIPDEARSPWAGCRDAIAAVVAGSDDVDDPRWSFRSVGRDGKEETTSQVVNVDVDEDDDDGGRGGGGGEDAAAVLVRCGCPTVDGWAAAELDAHGKRLAADAKRAAKKKRGGGGGGRKRGVVTTTATIGDARDGGGRGKRDDSAAESRDGRNGPENDVDCPPSRGVHLICGERKHAAAGTLHPCDFNPVSFDPECHSVDDPQNGIL